MIKYLSNAEVINPIIALDINLYLLLNLLILTYAHVISLRCGKEITNISCIIISKSN